MTKENPFEINNEASLIIAKKGENERLRKAFKWIEKEFQFEDYEKYKAQEEADEEISDYPYLVTAFFEQVGFLVEKKFVDLDVIDDRLGPYIVSNWKKPEPWIMALRKEKYDNTFGEHFQRLYEKTLKYMKKTLRKMYHVTPNMLLCVSFGRKTPPHFRHT